MSSGSETRNRLLGGGKVAEYVKQHQALNREERVVWRDAQKVQADI